MHPFRIVVASIKGGTGKTTTAVSLASIIARYRPTLLVDFDPQAQVAAHFGLKQRPSVAEWLLNERAYHQCLDKGRPNSLDLMLADNSSKNIGYKYAQQGNAYALSGMLQDIGDYDFQIYDTAAGGFLQEAALMASQHVVIPFRTEGASVISLKNIVEVIKTTTSSDVGITLLAVGYQKQFAIHRRNLQIVTDALGASFHIDPAMAVPHRVGVIEAFSEAETIWEYKDNTLAPVRAAYAKLAGYLFNLTEAAPYRYAEQLEKTYATPE